MYGQQYGGAAGIRGGAPGGGVGSQATYDAALLFLKQLNTKELQDLMDDTARLNRMVDELEIVKTQEQEKETQLASNKSIAEYNMSMEPRLVQSRQQLAETYDQAVRVQKDFEKNKLRLDSCAGSSSLDVTLALLQTEAAKAEDESEKCAEDYLSRRMTDVDDFLSKYVALRTLAHTRKVKADKMADIVREQERQRRAPPIAAPRTAPIPPQYGSAMGGTNGWAGGGGGGPGYPMGGPGYPVNPANQFAMPNAAAYR